MNARQIKDIISYAEKKLELKERDCEYKANRLLEIVNSGLEGAELEDAIYGELSLLPSEIDKRFSEILKDSGSKAATEWLYNYCVSNKYVKKGRAGQKPALRYRKRTYGNDKQSKTGVPRPEESQGGQQRGRRLCKLCNMPRKRRVRRKE